MASNDRRVIRNRQAILAAMIRLAGEKRWDKITVTDIIVGADVARSTFYKHFANKEDVLIASMHPMLTILAQLGGDLAWRTDLDRLLTHYWTSRALARSVFGGQRAEIVERALRDQINQVTSQETSMAVRQMTAIRVAAGRIALIREWVKGEFSAEPRCIADAIADCR
jgi:AcrR family transcriptional regulator